MPLDFLIGILLDYLEMFLKRNDQSLELRDKLAAVDTACDVEYQGSRVYKDIHIIVSSSVSLTDIFTILIL